MVAATGDKVGRVIGGDWWRLVEVGGLTFGDDVSIWWSW